MKKLPEIVPGDKNSRLNLYIFTAIYLLLLISLESVIDYFLMFNINSANLDMVNELVQKKKVLTIISYGILRMVPMLLLIWFGYRIISSARLPPARMLLPFSVPKQEGRNAKVTGLVIISLALLFIAQNITYTLQQLIG
jgi:hypothetical protein